MTTTRGISTLAAMAALTLAASSAAGQAAAPPAQATHETTKQLRAEAKVTEKAARATALAQVPGGRVSKHELERENGKLLYSFDIATKGKTGIDEVQIDAITGAVLSNKHETPAMEKAEAKAERKEGKAATKETKAEAKEGKAAAKEAKEDAKAGTKAPAKPKA